MRGTRVLGIAVATVVGISFVTACESESETAQAEFCKKLAAAAHEGVTGFEVTGNDFGRFSEGTMVRLDVSYTTADGNTVTAENKCWFPSRGGVMAIREFHIDRNGTVEKVSGEELQAIVAKVPS